MGSLFLNQSGNVSLQIGWQADKTRLGDQEFAIKIPVGFFGVCRLHEEFPNFGCVWSCHVPQLHQDSRKVFGCRKGLDFFIRREFLVAKLATGKAQYHQGVAMLPAQFFKQSIAFFRQASFAGHVGSEHDLA